LLSASRRRLSALKSLCFFYFTENAVRNGVFRRLCKNGRSQEGGRRSVKREKDASEQVRALEKRRRSLYNRENFGVGGALASAATRNWISSEKFDGRRAASLSSTRPRLLILMKEKTK
jgi:hypothetical protein